MSLSLDSLHGYETGKRYEKKLKFVSMFGNSNNRNIILEDEDGVPFIWSTSDRTKAYQNFQVHASYHFTVKYISSTPFLDENVQINITRLQLSKQHVQVKDGYNV